LFQDSPDEATNSHGGDAGNDEKQETASGSGVSVKSLEKEQTCVYKFTK
jgi:hypothetical protein